MIRNQLLVGVASMSTLTNVCNSDVINAMFCRVLPCLLLKFVECYCLLLLDKSALSQEHLVYYGIF